MYHLLLPWFSSFLSLISPYKIPFTAPRWCWCGFASFGPRPTSEASRTVTWPWRSGATCSTAPCCWTLPSPPAADNAPWERSVCLGKCSRNAVGLAVLGGRCCCWKILELDGNCESFTWWRFGSEERDAHEDVESHLNFGFRFLRCLLLLGNDFAWKKSQQIARPAGNLTGHSNGWSWLVLV